MGKYSEEDVTWSSIEKYIDYSNVVWSFAKNGIPKYVLMDENGNKIKIEI